MSFRDYLIKQVKTRYAHKHLKIPKNLEEMTDAWLTNKALDLGFTPKEKRIYARPECEEDRSWREANGVAPY